MNKKTKVAIIGIIALVLVTIGITYAYWLITRTQQGENVITTGCLDIALSGENDIMLNNQFPISGEDGMKLTPYTFTVTNNCNTSVDYQVALEALEAGDEISSDSLKVALDDTSKIFSEYGEVEATAATAYEARKMLVGTLSSKNTEGSSKTHELRVWIDADAPISEMNKTFKSKITVTVGQGISDIKEGTELASLILEDAETKNYLYTTTPDFNTVTAEGEYGLYSAYDDYGTSYYYRGDVENNYVKLGTWKETVSAGIKGCYSATNDISCLGGPFESIGACEAEGYYERCKEIKYADEGNDMYWRIVRINGDGTIRMVYDGTSATANSDIHSPIIKETAYNENYDNDKYIGYTYDDGTGTQVDSPIKGVVEDWYETNLEVDYGQYMADSVFCNDREDMGVDEEGFLMYGVYVRLYKNKTPKLTCTREDDKYTVSNAKGNGLLTKPIGLITADEIAMAGVRYGDNNQNYLYAGYATQWSMTPSLGCRGYDCVRYDSSPHVIILDSQSSGLSDAMINDYRGVRPVINLKADVQFTGNGTIGSPYEIVME